jgi:usherin
MFASNYTFYCESACINPLAQSSSNNTRLNKIDSLLNEQEFSIDELYIDTTPITNYSLTVGVCTNGGCGYSDPLFLTSLGEIPDGIFVPVLLARASDTLSIGWREPLYPSGDITGYILRMNENIVYFGLRKEFKIAMLKPLSNQSFSLEVCNSIGCARSALVFYQTTEMAPLSVPTPIILNITQTTISLKWYKPNNDQLINGILVGFILYVNNQLNYLNDSRVFNISNCMECSANLKDLDNLIPGTEYRIVLSACTNGGCTNSSRIRVRTLESLPLVDDIVIYTTNRTSKYMSIEWTRPKYPNGQPNKYTLFMNDKQIYEGLGNSFNLTMLSPNTFFKFHIVFCNNYGCSVSDSYRLSTDEDKPRGTLVLEAKATGSNQIQLKWFADKSDPLVRNGQLVFSGYFTGPFLVDFNLSTDAIDFIKQNKPFIEVTTLNLVNTTIFNTKYGILDRILPYSEYRVQINASNTKGYLLSNIVKVETLKSNPDLLIPPQLVSSTWSSLKLEWYEPILLNSDDRILFYQIEYKIKYLWNSAGVISNPVYERKIFRVFSEKSSSTLYTLTGLRAYTAYMFQLSVYNSYGEEKSEWTKDYITEENVPSAQDRPTAVEFGSNYTIIEWRQPQVSNGIITSFQILVFKCILASLSFAEPTRDLAFNITQEQDDPTTKLEWGNIMRYNVTNLEPFTYYLFAVSACNTIGCAVSLISKNFTTDPTLTRTKPSLPEYFQGKYKIRLNI